MNILDAIKQLRDDIKTWVANNLNDLNIRLTKSINNIPKFSGNYNDLINAPDIVEDESGNMIIADEEGNIIFKVNSDGIHSTALSLNGSAVATEAYVNDAMANIDIPETGLEGYATEEFVENTVDSMKEELSEYITSESDEWKVTDGAGNIIFSVGADGAHTTALSINGEPVEDIIDEKVAALVDNAPETLNTLNELSSALGDDSNFATTIANQIGKKVDKVDGKGLSTNDFTNEYKNIIDNLGDMAFNETDPTVPEWAKEPEKPTYTAEEIGALSKFTTLSDLADDTEHRTVSDTEKSIWNNKSDFTGNYNDLDNAPNIVEDESGNMVIADIDGNIIFRADNNGYETPQVITKTLILDGTDIELILNDKADKNHSHGDVYCTSAQVDTKIQTYINEAILGGEW